MDIGVPLIGIGAAAFGAGFSQIGQDKANKENAEQAQLNRDFQERMSNTQYQRAVADITASGLNPALLYQQGGAGNVSGSTAASMQNTAGQVVQATQQIPNTLLQNQLQQAQLRQIDSATFNNWASAQKTQSETDYQRIQNSWVEANAGQAFESRTLGMKLTGTQINEINQRMDQNSARFNLELATSAAKLRQAIAEADIMEISKQREAFINKLTELKIPEAQAYADYFMTKWGRGEPYRDSATKIVDTVKGVLPWSGLMGSAKANAATMLHNSRQVPGLIP